MKIQGYSKLTIKKVDMDKRTFEGIATTPTTDRVGDIVESEGAKFKLPLPLLWQHDSGDPIGWIHEAKVTSDGIAVKGEVADVPEPGALKERLLDAWQKIKYKLVAGLSIGFNALEYAEIKGTWGYRFTSWEWLELSAVTIPANQEATITAIKSAVKTLAASGHKFSGVSDRLKTKGIADMKTLREQLTELKEARTMKAARLSEIADAIKDESASTEEVAEFDSLEVEIGKLDNDIRIKSAEVVNAAKAQPVTSPVKAPAVHIKSNDTDDKFEGQSYTRFVIAKALAHLTQVSPLAIATQRGWHKSNPTLFNVIKAAVEGGGAGSGEWGAELVAADARYTGDFIEFLKSRTVFDRLGLREIPANVQVKGQDGTATGYWVGESKAIPASAQDFSAVNLTPLKVAALAVVSNELLRDSSPAAEMLVRDSLADASAQRIDATFLSTSAASAGVSPAGILNGVSAKSTAGNDGDGVAADLKALYADFITAKNASGLALVMNPALGKALSLMRNALGQYEYPSITQDGGTLLGDSAVTGDNVNASHFILLKPSDIYKIGDLGVEVSISREATIEMDGAPAMDSQAPTGASGAMVNMFQTESTAIKVVRPINFAKRRASAVQYVGDAAYGAAST